MSRNPNTSHMPTRPEPSFRHPPSRASADGLSDEGKLQEPLRTRINGPRSQHTEGGATTAPPIPDRKGSQAFTPNRASPIFASLGGGGGGAKTS